MNNKRGSVFLIFVFLIILFVSATVVLYASSLSKIFFNKLGTEQLIVENENSNKQISYAKNIGSYADTSMFIIFLGFLIVLIAGAVYSNFHPVMLGLFVLVLLVGVFVAYGAGNIYTDLRQGANLQGQDDLTFTNAILNSAYLPAAFFILGILLLIIMYSRVQAPR